MEHLDCYSKSSPKEPEDERREGYDREVAMADVGTGEGANSTRKRRAPRIHPL